MGRVLSTSDLARLETASRTLLSPLAFPSADHWRGEVMRTVAELFGAESGTFGLASAPRAVAVYGLQDEADLHMNEILTPIYRHSGPSGFDLLDGFMAGIRARRLTVWDMHSGDSLLGGAGLAWNNPWFHEVLDRYGAADTHALYLPSTEGDTLLTFHGFRRPASPGEHLPVMAALYPSFVAGIKVLDRLAAHRAALDDLDEPLAVYDVDGTETHRNPALGRLLADDPEAERVATALAEAARRTRPLAFARRGERAGPEAPVTDVRTAHAAYTLRPVLLAPGALGHGDAFLVSVAARGARAVLPSADALRQSVGLTRREAEVTLLVAEGMTNDQVAERLFVSAHTVRHHLESAMGKLELTGRGRESVAARLLSTEEA